MKSGGFAARENLDAINMAIHRFRKKPEVALKRGLGAQPRER